jgi:2-octaprenyl-6-methoxyphenol hydroxylase
LAGLCLIAASARRPRWLDTAAPASYLWLMTQTIQCDVAIAGGGLVGLSLALALDQAGMTVAVADPLPPSDQLEATFDGRSSAIAFATYRMLQALGVAERIGAVQPIEQILVTDGRPDDGLRKPGPSLLTLQFDRQELGADAPALGYLIENRRIRLALDEAVRARPGILRLAPATVASVQASTASAGMTLADGRAVEARVLVGADGRGSRVRAAAGIRTYGWSYRQTGLVATVALERPHGGVAHEYFLPNGPFAILPLTEDRASLVWTETDATAKALAALPPAALGAELMRRFGDFLGTVSVTGPIWTYPLSMELAAEWVRPRLALAGDAAHGVHPIAGQGLNLGLKDVAALAETIAKARSLGLDIGDLTVLREYERWRRFDTMALAAGMDAFVRLFSTDAAPIRAIRTIGMSLVDAIGPARRFFMRHAGAATGDLPRLLRGERLA